MSENRRGYCRVKRAVTLVMAVGVALLTGCTPPIQSERAPATPTSSMQAATSTPIPTPYPTPTELSSLVLGPPPADCPTTSLHLSTISPNIAPAFGSGPVWAAPMMSTFHSTVLKQTGEKPDPRYGWFWKLIWEVGPSYEQPVTIHGTNMHTGAPLWFNLNPDAPNTVTMVLDPQQPGHAVSAVGQDWHEWGSYMYIPVAGCYELEADWSGGQWQIIFAAGA